MKDHSRGKMATERPWKTQLIHTSDGWVMAVHGEKEDWFNVCIVKGKGMEANAELIVQAVNEREELLRCVGELRAALSWSLKVIEFAYMNVEEQPKEIQQVRAVLKASEGVV